MKYGIRNSYCESRNFIEKSKKKRKKERYREVRRRRGEERDRGVEREGREGVEREKARCHLFGFKGKLFKNDKKSLRIVREDFPLRRVYKHFRGLNTLLCLTFDENDLLFQLGNDTDYKV